MAEDEQLGPSIWRTLHNSDAPTVEGDPSKHVKIYRYIDVPLRPLNVAPIDVDYVTGLNRALLRRREFAQTGALVANYYYAEATEAGTLADLIVSTHFTYVLDAVKWPVSHTKIIRWYLEDGTEAPETKTETKIYTDHLGKIATLQTWRQNQVSTLKMQAIGLLGMVMPRIEGETEADHTVRAMREGQEFLARHKLAFTNYVEDANWEIIAVLNADPAPWLVAVIPDVGVTIRDYLISGLIADG